MLIFGAPNPALQPSAIQTFERSKLLEAAQDFDGCPDSLGKADIGEKQIADLRGDGATQQHKERWVSVSCVFRGTRSCGRSYRRKLVVRFYLYLGSFNEFIAID